MTFAAPLFLLAALAAAIPVVLHLVSRQRAKDLPFPTLRFLKLSAEKTRRRKRIHDALLMAAPRRRCCCCWPPDWPGPP